MFDKKKMVKHSGKKITDKSELFSIYRFGSGYRERRKLGERMAVFV